MEDESISVKILGKGVAAKGPLAIVVLVLGFALAGSMYLLYERTENSERHIEEISAQHSRERAEQTQQFTREHAQIVAAIGAVQSVNEKIGNLLDEQNFIVLSDEGARKDMKRRLRMPPSLAMKLDRGW